MMQQFYSLTMFDLQAFYARDQIMGAIELPGEADQKKWLQEHVDEENKIEAPLEKAYC